jgi:hypothetical protein
MYQYSALLWEMGKFYLCLLQTPQTLKFSWSCHNENVMVGSPRWGLYALKILDSVQMLGRSYSTRKWPNLTGKCIGLLLVELHLIDVMKHPRSRWFILTLHSLFGDK